MLDSFNIAIKNGLLMKLVIIGNSCNFKTQDGDSISKIKEQMTMFYLRDGYLVRTFIIIILHAECLVQPSLYEGFGIPPLEALYLGCSVIVSDILFLKKFIMIFLFVFF